MSTRRKWLDQLQFGGMGALLTLNALLLAVYVHRDFARWFCEAVLQ